MTNWFLESNRYKHFLYAIPCGMIGTILFVLGLAVGMEYKDVLWGGRWDWLDFICTIIGGLIGNITTFLIILSFI
jgi:uncharacterized membrane protein